MGNSRPYLVRFQFEAAERLEIGGQVIHGHRERVSAHSWEHAVLEAAASAPAVLASRILRALVREHYEVMED